MEYWDRKSIIILQFKQKHCRIELPGLLSTVYKYDYYQFPNTERQFMHDFNITEDEKQYIIVRGEALKKMRNGFCCLYGSYENLRYIKDLIDGNKDMKEIDQVYILNTATVPDLKIRDDVMHAFDKLGNNKFVLCIKPPQTKNDIIAFPGGKRHLCETSKDCALREFKEECGFDPLDYASAINTTIYTSSFILLIQVNCC